MKKSQPIRVIAAHRPVFATATELRRGMGEREREREGGKEGGVGCRESKCGKDEEEEMERVKVEWRGREEKAKERMTKKGEIWLDLLQEDEGE